MSNMTMNVEFIGGTSIHSAISDARSKAIMFDIAYIQFNFNDASFSVGKHCDVITAVQYWNDNPQKKHYCFN